MRIRRFPLLPPLEAPPPDMTVQNFQATLQRMIDAAAAKRESSLVRAITGCDGRPIVTAYLGACQDQARAINGGSAALAIDLGNGARVVVARDLGRGYSASAGYSGASFASGAFPSPNAAQAAALELDPIDDAEGITVEGHPADIGTAVSGAAAVGKAGVMGRYSVYALVFPDDESGVQLWYWADVTSADPPVQITTTSLNLKWVAQITATRAVAVDVDACDIWFFESGVEVGSHHVSEFDAPFSTWCLPLDVFDGGDKMVVSGQIYYAPGVPYDPGYGRCIAVISGLLTGSCTVVSQVILGAVAADYWFAATIAQETGTIFCCSANSDYTLYTPTGLNQHTFYRWDPPYSSPPVALKVTPNSTAGVYTNLVASPNGRYVIAIQAAGGSATPWTPVIWAISGGTAWGSLVNATSRRTELVDTGKRQHYIDRQGRYWLLTDDGYAAGYIQRYDPPYHAAPIYEIGSGDNCSGWLTVGNDGAFAVYTEYAGSFRYIAEPLQPGATPVDVTLPVAGIVRYLAIIPDWVVPDATGLIARATNQSIAPSGGSLEIVTRVTVSNPGVSLVWGIKVTCPLPARTTFVSASDDGVYDPDTGIVTWLIASVAAGSSAYVTMTTSRP